MVVVMLVIVRLIPRRPDGWKRLVQIIHPAQFLLLQLAQLSQRRAVLAPLGLAGPVGHPVPAVEPVPETPDASVFSGQIALYFGLPAVLARCP